MPLVNIVELLREEAPPGMSIVEDPAAGDAGAFMVRVEVGGQRLDWWVWEDSFRLAVSPRAMARDLVREWERMFDAHRKLVDGRSR